MELSQRILSYLEQNPNSSAKEIAKFLNVERTVVNSFLYSAKGEIVLKNNDSLPLWRLLKVTNLVENKVRKLLPRKIAIWILLMVDSLCSDQQFFYFASKGFCFKFNLIMTPCYKEKEERE